MTVERLRLPFFVYGTLRPGRENHDLYLRGRTAEERPALLRGAVMYEGPGWPYAVAEPGGEIHGELITPATEHYDALLVALDRLEDYAPGDPANIYERVAREVILGDGEATGAWVYLAAEPVARRLRASGTLVPGGDWVSC
ncbi:gamma-glutamylcyclotransferase family protein [Streptomyces sp. NPDC051776]|uniref:gamma-glutamylcyclotransferase family protein n=1 Tax=Streptomyces sp. NPDC051776 TaxID=3155414 RepID=UPI003448D8F9